MTRIRDILTSLLGLTLLLPVLAFVSIAVRLRLGSPILICQTRPGEDPMATDALRLTRLGRFLRSTSLDELPTL